MKRYISFIILVVTLLASFSVLVSPHTVAALSAADCHELAQMGPLYGEVGGTAKYSDCHQAAYITPYCSSISTFTPPAEVTYCRQNFTGPLGTIKDPVVTRKYLSAVTQLRSCNPITRTCTADGSEQPILPGNWTCNAQDICSVTSEPSPSSPAGSAVICSRGQLVMKDGKTCCPAGSQDDATKCLFAKYINPVIKMLSVMAGLAAIIGMILGAIQYSASGGDPQKTALGKSKIIKAVYGLVAFLFLYSALQFFSPGGISSNIVPIGGSASAATCSKKFLGLNPWFAYLPANNFNSDCSISDNFQLLGTPDKKDASGAVIQPGIPSSLPLVVLAVADNLVRIAGFVAVAFVIMGGIKFVTSQGEPDKTKQARDSIINALIGLVMAILAAAVVSYIGGRLS